jgi:aspartate aminotransferase
VYGLNIGEPDTAPPEVFYEGLRKAEHQPVPYEAAAGFPPLRDAWASWLNRSLKIDTRPDDFLVTTGASEALIFSFLTCCDAGDEILVLDPTYANFAGFAAMADVRLKPIELAFDDGFEFPPVAALASEAGPQTRAVLLCHPNNPTGAVPTAQQLQDILSFCESRNIMLIVDETYRELVFDGRQPLSILQIHPDHPGVIVIDSLSKQFSLCGARVGFVYSANQAILEAMDTLAQCRLAAPSLAQRASAHMLQHLPSGFSEKRAIEFEARRDALVQPLANHPNVDVHNPAGGFYAMVRLPVENAADFAAFLLTDYHVDGCTVQVAPAEGFFVAPGLGRDLVRVAFVCPPEELTAAAQILSSGLDAYQER